MKDVAEEYTEFDRATPTRIDGKAMTMRFAEAYASGPGGLVASDMANPKVQVYRDVAILSYNFIGAARTADGTIEPSLAKRTRESRGVALIISNRTLDAEVLEEESIEELRRFTGAIKSDEDYVVYRVVGTRPERARLLRSRPWAARLVPHSSPTK